MVSINYATREVCCKIVYYGPGLSGKTTNLQVVHKKVPQNTRGKLISLATEADRTLYFDFLPINIGSINGFAAKFQLYTVPGQVYYNATRRLVLRGVDGVVFVADSQADKHDDNMESLSNLKENLEEYGYDVDELPIVIQYNKNDLPTALNKEEMDAKLNDHNWPSYTAAAVDGVGVFDTLKAIMKLVLEKAKKGGTSSKSPKKPVLEPAVAEGASSTVDAQAAQSQAAQSIATPAREAQLAAKLDEGAQLGNPTQPVAAIASPPEPKAKSLAGSGGGLFGAPRSASGRGRHSSFATGPVGSGPIGPSATVNHSTSRDSETTGKVEVEVGGGDVNHSTSPNIVTSDVVSANAGVDLASEKQEVTSQASMVGHDPLEQAPPKPKQKKRGFFSRLFGRK